MKKVFFTPGPSQAYPGLADFIAEGMEAQISSISHRSQAFMDLYAETETTLRSLLAVPEDYQLFFFASATEIWERLAQNAIEEHSFHLVCGSFSQRFYKAAQLMGKTAQLQEAPFGAGFDPAQIAVPEQAEMIAVVANETSSGVMMPPEDIYLLRDKHPEKLLVVDCVSAFPAYDLDLSRVDGAYFSVQKGFGLPAGLGVLVLSPKLLQKGLSLEEKGFVTGTYHRFSALLDKAKKKQTPETPNVLAIHLLGKVAGDLAKDLDAVRAASKQKAALLYDFIDGHPDLEIAVADPRLRSETVIVANHSYENPAAKLAELEAKGFVLGTGYGKYKTKQFRFANFPALSVADVQALIAAF